MNPINRAVAVLTQPAPTMSRAASEPATVNSLIATYAALLAALPALALLLATILNAGAALQFILTSVLVSAILLYLLRDLGVTILIGFGLGALAPNFGGRRDNVNAVKLAVYAATPIWIAGLLLVLLGVLLSLGNIGYLILLLGFAFAGFILYVGVGPMLGVPQSQAPIVAGITTIAWIVLYYVAEQIVGRIFVQTLIGGLGI